MSTLILRLTRGWYDPAVQQKREARTRDATVKSMVVFNEARTVEVHVQAARNSYENSERRMAPRSNCRGARKWTRS